MNPQQTHFLEYCQRRLSAEEHPHIIAAWGRYVGCSTVNGHLAIQFALQKADMHIAYFRESSRANPDLFDNFKEIYKKGQACRNGQAFRFANGSLIHFLNPLQGGQIDDVSYNLCILDQVSLDLNDGLRAALDATKVPIIFNVDLSQRKHATVEYSIRNIMQGWMLVILSLVCKQHQAPSDIAIHVVRYFL